ncbi:MAG: LysM peptidoglycan-binding domain-containing protein [Prosthecobacter sp.]|nr:LysM peptidoglycan-binding domain-containing protein [Prosthecobacter sp.]
MRLHHLEREVGSLAPASHRPATDIQGEFSSAGPPGKLYTVRSGDTLWRIAAKYSTSINAIRAANRMSGDTVATGQTLMIPGGEHLPSSPASPGIHVVSPGETFSGVAQTYRVTQDALARANPSAYPDRLLIGERLIIPGARSVTVPDYAPVINPPSSIASRAPNHTVREGESLGAIAKKYGVSTARLAAANKLKNPNLVEVGQQLVVPSATAPTSMSLPSSKLVMHSHSAPDVETIPLPGAGLATLNRPSVPALAPMPAPAPPKLPSLAPVYPPSAPVSKPAMPTGPHRGVVAYRLERGDDLSTVANMFSTTPAKIRELNMLAANTELKAGDEVVVPALGPVSVD